MAIAIRKKLFVVVNGVTYDENDSLEIDADTEYYSLPWDSTEENGAVYKNYRAGVTTWKITVAGNVVYRGTDHPTRTETEDSITYTIPPALTPDDTQEVDAITRA